MSRSTIFDDEDSAALLSAPTLMLGDCDPETPVPEHLRINPKDLLDTEHEKYESDGEKKTTSQPAPAIQQEPSVEAAPQSAPTPGQAQVGDPPQVSVVPQVQGEVQVGTTAVVEAEPEKKNVDRCTTQSFGDGQDTFSMLEAMCNMGDSDIPSELLPGPVDSEVLSEPLLPPWQNENAAIDLKTCLGVHFEKGLKPDEHMAQISEYIVSWMKQVYYTPCHTMWGSQFQKGLEAFSRMKKSAERIKEKVSVSTSTLKAVATSALKSYADTQKLYEGKPNQMQVLESKSNALQKWVSTRQQTIRTALTAESETHQKALEEFAKEISRLAGEAYQQHLEDKSCPMIDEDMLFKELDQTLEMEISDPPEQVAPTAENPEVIPDTLAFEEIVSKALGKSSMTPNTQKNLATKLQQTFSSTLFASGDGQAAESTAPSANEAPS